MLLLSRGAVYEALLERVTSADRFDDALVTKCLTVLAESLACAELPAILRPALAALCRQLADTRTNAALRDVVLVLLEYVGAPEAGASRAALAPAAGGPFDGLGLSSACLLECDLFGPQFRRRAKAKRKNELDTHKALAVKSPELLCARVAEVAADRMRRAHAAPAGSPAPDAGGAHDGIAVAAKLRRRTQQQRTQLFHYKYYRDQVRLGVSEAEMADVVGAVVAPPDAKTRQMASKVLIKILVDIYCAADAVAIDAISAVFLELLAGDTDSRVHAFNLAFNLSVHLYLLEEAYPLQAGNAHAMSHYAGALTRIGLMQDDVFAKLGLMLAHCAQRNERDAAVLETALAVLLYFILDNGALNEPRARCLAPGVALMFLSGLTLAPRSEAVLVRLLVLACYRHSRAETLATDSTVQSLESVVGSVAPVLALYASARSRAACNDLFCLLLDYVVACMRQRAVAMHASQAEAIRSLLLAFDAPVHFARLGAHTPAKFVEVFLRHLFFEQMRRTDALAEAAKAVDKTAIVVTLYDLEKLGASCSALPSEAVPGLAALCDPATPAASAAAMQAELLAMLCSPALAERAAAVARLAHVYSLAAPGAPVASSDGDSPAATPAPAAATEAFAVTGAARAGEVFGACMSALLATGSACSYHRQTALDVAERCVLWRAAAIEPAGDEAGVQLLMHTLNDVLGAFVRAGERHAAVLLRMVELVLRVIAVPNGGTPCAAMADTLAEAYLAGQAVLARELVKLLDVALVAHVFRCLPPSASAARVVLLAMIICKASQRRTLAAVGGMAFFTALLRDSDERVAYVAAQFLAEQLMTEKPDQYRALLDRLQVRWRSDGLAASAMENEYVQITGILEQRAK